MSKTDVKNYIQSLDRVSLEQLVMDLYSAKKEAKEFLEYTIKPNDMEKLEEYRQIIKREFFPKRGIGKMRFSVCRKAVSDYKKLDPIPEFLADLMLSIPEYASEMTQYGDLWEQFYISAANNFEAAMKYIAKNNLQKKFQYRIDKILNNSKSSGWGFEDDIFSIYHEYKE